MQVQISRNERILTYTVDDAAMWSSTNGPVIKAAGYTSGSIYRSGIANPTFQACSGFIPDGGTGTAPDRGPMNLADGTAVPTCTIPDGEWAMIPYEWFFFRCWQMIVAAPTGSQEIKVYMQG